MNQGLQFRLTDAIEVDAPSYARFNVVLDGEPLWPVAASEAFVEIFVDDILDYLTDFWGPLLLRQTYPLAFNEPPDRPSALHIAAASRWLRFPENQVEIEQSLVSAFEDSHNLARCFGGQFGLPQLWLLRDREEMIVDTGDRLVRVKFRQAVAAMTSLGNEIATRLEDHGQKSKLIAAWRAREEVSGIRMVELRAGLSSEKATDLVRTRYLSAPASLVEAANDDDEIVLAARMAGALPLEDIKRIIKLAKSFAPSPSISLIQLATRVRGHLDSSFAGAKPFEQGEAAAQLVRSLPGRDINGLFDVRALAINLGVEVKEHNLSLVELIGLAISGTHHGPGILLNKGNKRLMYANSATREAMLRYTLAHELCHLLLDGEHSLTAVDVLSGRMDPATESRAQSFAGELLFPTRLAKSLWETHGSPTTQAELERVVAAAVEQFRVTRSVAAWKIEHAGREVDVDLRYVLNILARYR